MCIRDRSRHSPRSSLVASKGFTVHSRGPHFRQDQAQEKYEFNQSPKYLEIRPSQPRNIENFGGGSVACLKITEDKSSKSRVQTPDAWLIIATTTAPKTQGSKPASQPYCSSITIVSRREDQNPRLYFTTTTKTQSPEPASHTKLDLNG